MRTTKFAALFAAVALLVVGATFATFAADPYWAQEGEDWVYYDKNGDQVFDDWAPSGDGWYYLNEDGVMAKSELIRQDEKKVYYVDETGRMVTNTWIKVFDDDYADANEDDVNFRWFYFGSDGKAYRNAKKDVPTAAGTKEFIFNADCEMVYGWAKEGKDFANNYQDGLYYCGEADDGAVVKGDWRELVTDDPEEDDTAWFYFKATTGAKYAAKSGELTTKEIGGKTYAFDEFGCMKTEWATASGSNEVNFYDENGAKVIKGWFYTWAPNSDQEDEDDKNWYYAKKKGVVAVGEVISDGGKFYLLGYDGVLKSGLVKITWETKQAADGKISITDEIKAIKEIDAFADITIDDPDAEAIYYLNEEHDGTFGAVMTGTHDVTDDDDEEYTLTFDSASTMKKGNGMAYQGANGNSWYTNGEKLTGDADDNKYYIVKVTAKNDDKLGKSKFADTGIVVDPKSAVEPFKLEEGHAGDYACMSASGTFYKSLTNRKESNGDYKITVEKWLVKKIDEVE